MSALIIAGFVVMCAAAGVGAEGPSSVPSEPSSKPAAPSAPAPRAQPWLGLITSEMPRLEVHTKDKAHMMRVFLGLQPMLQIDDTVVTPTFRRIRTGINASLLNDKITVLMQLNLVPGSLELMDAYIDGAIHPQLIVRAGQFTTPFTRYRQMSYQRQSFVDWPIVTRAFGAERQLGIALHNGYRTLARFSYAIGVFHGQNARRSHGVGIADMYGVELGNPSALANPMRYSRIHPEIVARAGYASHGDEAVQDADEKRTGLRGLGMASFAWDTGPVYGQDAFMRASLEGLVKFRGLSGMLIGYLSTAKLSDGRHVLALAGGIAQLSYRLPWPVEIAFRYALVNATPQARADAYAHAQELLAQATTETETAVATHMAQLAGLRIHDQEATLGVNFFLMSHTLKIQADASWLGTAYVAGPEHHARVRLMAQAAF